YRPPIKGEPIDEVFLLQVQEASRSQALILLVDFNHPDTCWKSNTASCRQSRRFLEYVEDNFLGQEPTRKGALLDMVFINKEELVMDVKIKGSLGCSDQEIVEFGI
ncbi:hypothetical protein FQV18_0000386, partial [Eudyptula minor novaehollandiae]